MQAALKRHLHTPAAVPTSMAVVSQILGELNAAAVDDEWMYAIGDGGDTGAASATESQGRDMNVNRKLDAADAVAIRKARAILRRFTSGGRATHAGFDDSASASDDAEGSTEGPSSCTSTGRSGIGTGSAATAHGTNAAAVPLGESNRIYMLVGDVARLRERGATPSAAALRAIGDPSAGPVDVTSAAAINIDIDGPASTATSGSDQQASHVMDVKIQDIDVVLRRWEAAALQGGTNAAPAAAAAAAVVRALLRSVFLQSV
jgi:hypothetical protein